MGTKKKWRRRRPGHEFTALHDKKYKANKLKDLINICRVYLKEPLPNISEESGANPEENKTKTLETRDAFAFREFASRKAF